MVAQRLCVRCGRNRTSSREGICKVCRTDGEEQMATPSAPGSSLGQRTRWSRAQGKRIRDADRGLTRTELNEQIAGARHGTCVEHVRVAGYVNPICILRGQDRDRVIAEAIELSGMVRVGRALYGEEPDGIQGGADEHGSAGGGGGAG